MNARILSRSDQRELGSRNLPISPAAAPQRSQQQLGQVSPSDVTGRDATTADVAAGCRHWLLFLNDWNARARLSPDQPRARLSRVSCQGFVPRSPHWERSRACDWLAGSPQPCRPCLMHKSGRRRASGGLGLCGLVAWRGCGLWPCRLVPSLRRPVNVAGPATGPDEVPTGGADASAPKISHSDGAN